MQKATSNGWISSIDDKENAPPGDLLVLADEATWLELDSTSDDDNATGMADGDNDSNSNNSTHTSDGNSDDRTDSKNVEQNGDISDGEDRNEGEE